jgi:hypothetical protein
MARTRICLWLVLAALSCDRRPSDAPAVPTATPAAPQPAAVYDGPMVQTDGPINYFADRCSRCHGDVANAYAGRTNFNRDKLKQTIAEMAEQRAMAPLDETGVQQQYDLHIAIAEKRPYLWIDESQKDVLAGEVVGGSKVVLKTAGKTIGAKTEGSTFVLPRTPGSLIVTRGGTSIEKDVK